MALKWMLEASRAASLAAHSAASLAAAAKQKEAGRLLRSAEALARAATAVLLSQVSPPPAASPSGGEKDEGKRKRRRKKKTAKVKPGEAAANSALAPVSAAHVVGVTDDSWVDDAADALRAARPGTTGSSSTPPPLATGVSTLQMVAAPSAMAVDAGAVTSGILSAGLPARSGAATPSGLSQSSSGALDQRRRCGKCGQKVGPRSLFCPMGCGELYGGVGEPVTGKDKGKDKGKGAL